MRSRKTSTWAGLAVATAIAIAAPRLADANKKRIVVLEVRGTLSVDLRAVLSKLLGADHRIISASDYEKTAKQLRATAITDRNVARVAKKLGAEGVIHGWITTTKDDKLLLRLRLRNGSNGKVVKKLAVLVESEKLSRDVRVAIKRRLLDAIDKLRYVEVDTHVEKRSTKRSHSKGRVESTKAKPKKKKKGKKTKRKKTRERNYFDDDENPLAPKGGKKSKAESSSSDSRLAEVDEDDIQIDGEDDEELESEADSDEDESEPRRNDGRPAGDLVAAAVDVGLSVTSRTLAFDSRADLTNAPAGYHGPMVPALHLGAEIYPGLLDDRSGILSRLGAGVVIDRVFGLQTAVDGGDGVTLPTTEMRYGADLRYRQRLGKPTLTASIGLSRLSFVVAKESAPSGVTVDVPNTSYTYVDPGVAVSMPVADKIALAGHAKILLVLDAGEVQSVEQYGAGTVTGYDLEVGGSYALTSAFTLAAALSYRGFSFDFHGTGELATNRDGDPSTVDVGGASDRYLAAYFTASYAL